MSQLFFDTGTASGADGGTYEYTLDFGGSSISQITIEGDFGVPYSPWFATGGSFWGVLPIGAPAGSFNFNAADGTFTYTLTLSQAVAALPIQNFYVFGTGIEQPSQASGIDGDLVRFIPTNMCFAAGTWISTINGETAVESLQIGDMVTTADGRAVPIKWVGRQILCKICMGERMQPVRIRAGTLDDGLPHADLTVTADHGMVIDGYVINASALVNGESIDFVPMDELADSFTVYHIETENHDVILANGAPSETFLDAATRASFDNHQEYLDLYGTDRIIPEMQAPRITSARLLPEVIKNQLAPGSPVKTSLAQTA